ncbi:MAG: hypothetical protein R3F49_13130 [Planctomycetota bacterium]
MTPKKPAQRRSKASPGTIMQRFEAALQPGVPPDEAACLIAELEPKLPDAAIQMMDDHLASVDPLVKVALIDAYYRMTECTFHRGDLEALKEAARAGAARGDAASEDVFAAATIAYARQAGAPEDTWVRRGFEITGVRAPRPRPRRKGLAADAQLESITIMIHGTWATHGRWWRRGGDFFEYVRKDLGLADLYGAADQFRWSGDNLDSSRARAARELHGWLSSHRAASVRVFAHSHGANIAALATHKGTRIDKFVMLSPPVRKDYLPDWSNVGQAYNIQACFDAVVAIARGGQWFKDVMRARRVTEHRLKSSGHSASHSPAVWKKERLARIVGLPWD